ncbi:hypothetical protein [Actinomadura meridiana]|uniref:hypothetical protein n=1 Tax=Actinomadura meridiana TaxID=559626 RepID=UPI0031EFA1A5
MVEAFIRDLDERGHRAYLSYARDLAHDLAEAVELETGDARFLALAEARDKARSLRHSVVSDQRRAAKAENAARTDLEFVSDASPWIGQERLTQAQDESYATRRNYAAHASASTHLRKIIRSIGRDLAREAAAARAGGTPRAVTASRRLIELSLRLAVQDPAPRRRDHWTKLHKLGPHPNRAQLRYAVVVLLREFGSLP